MEVSREERAGDEKVPDDLEARLWSADGLDEVEALMCSLSAGDHAPDLSCAMLQEHLSTGGKRIRARLALVGLEALGVPRQHGIGWAAACEMVHNATLVHDDIQDGDRVRRGQPTVWARHGVAQAINAGDLMLMLPFMALDRVPVRDGVRWHLARALAHGAASTVRGQSLEMELRDARRVDPEGYIETIEGKTGALFGLPVEGAAHIAGLAMDQVRRLARAFTDIGLLFQVQDDVLDLFGQKGRDEVGADVREGKVSALVVEHLQLHPGDREWLLGILLTPRDKTTDSDVQAVIDRFREDGALEATLRRIARQRQEIERSAVLQDFPPVRRLALALAKLILEPISHLEIPADGGTPP